LLGYDRILEKRFGGPGKSWKSPGIFCKQESGNPDRLSSDDEDNVIVIKHPLL